MSLVSMSDGNSRIRWYSNRTRNTGYDFKRNSSLRQRLRFLTPTAKNERVAAFQPADVFPFPCFLNHQPVDVFLSEVFIAGLFPDVDYFRIRPGLLEEV